MIKKSESDAKPVEKKHRSAFLIIYLGELPEYFDFWAKTCEPNQEDCHWYVYNDQVTMLKRINRAVTIVPYTFNRLCKDMKSKAGIHVPEHNTRIVCDCRIMLYSLRKEEENLEKYDFVGYSDIDVLYGKIKDFMPENPIEYSIISGHDGRPCGPFTLFNRKYIEKILSHDHIKQHFERNFGTQTYQSHAYKDPSSKFKPISGNRNKDKISASINFSHLDESLTLINIAEQYAPTFCKSSPLQPTMSKGFNHRKAIAFWKNGRIFVMDNRGHSREGGFFHFSRFKSRSRFKVNRSLLSSDQWGIFKYGFIELKSKLTTIKMLLTLLY